jgi:predicted HAD superfamily Cof-like phosphohydrolase
MTKVFRDVQVFMNAAEQTTTQDNQTQAELYKKLIKEEYDEFWEAEALSDEVEEIDACFDMMWVIVGYMLSKGYDVDGIWDEGALSNLKKIDKETRKVLKREDGKVLKPEGWKPPNFSRFAAKK